VHRDALVEVRTQFRNQLHALLQQPDETNLAQVHKILIQQALATLAPDQRRAITLAYYADLTECEIAERLHAPLGTVKSRVRLGLRHLQNCCGSMKGSATQGIVCIDVTTTEYHMAAVPKTIEGRACLSEEGANLPGRCGDRSVMVILHDNEHAFELGGHIQLQIGSTKRHLERALLNECSRVNLQTVTDNITLRVVIATIKDTTPWPVHMH
jgi:hypothetical protein